MLAAEMGDGKQYGCSRDFAASVGLVPRQYSTGDKANLLGISKRGDKNIRRLLVQCARAYMQRLDRQSGRLADWVRAMLTRRGRGGLRTGEQAGAHCVGAGDPQHQIRCRSERHDLPEPSILNDAL